MTVSTWQLHNDIPLLDIPTQQSPGSSSYPSRVFRIPPNQSMRFWNPFPECISKRRSIRSPLLRSFNSATNSRNPKIYISAAQSRSTGYDVLIHIPVPRISHLKFNWKRKKKSVFLLLNCVKMVLFVGREINVLVIWGVGEPR